MLCGNNDILLSEAKQKASMLQICIKPFEFHANNDLTNKVVSRFCSSATNGSRSRGPIILTIALSQSITYM